MDEYFEEALGAGSNHHHHEEEVDEYLMKYSDESDSIDEMERRRSCRGFDCNICLDSVEEPVVTLCGHLYCWPCIYKWMNTNNSNENEEEQQQYCCPVCRSDISQDTLVPIYQTTDYNSSQPSGVIIPPRPAIQFVESNSSILFFDNNHNIEETSNISINSYNGIFGKLVYWRFLGNSSGNPNNSYNLAGTTTSPRLRHHLMKMDESLNRMSFFLLCCALACLILF